MYTHTLHIYADIRTHTYIRTHAHTHTHTHTHVQTHIHTHACTHALTQTHTHLHSPSLGLALCKHRNIVPDNEQPEIHVGRGIMWQA